MTTKQITFRPIKENRRRIRICQVYRPNRTYRLDPIVRGTYLWLREQALNAEQNPNREWEGFENEWNQLLSRTHPDPHPEIIIYGHPVDNFDPTTLNNPKLTLSLWDTKAYDIALSEDPQRRGMDLPPKSQQFFAAISRIFVEDLLEHDTGSTLSFEEHRNQGGRQ